MAAILMRLLLKKCSAIPRCLGRCVHSRNSELAGSLAKRISFGGPITVADYMRECLLNPAHGYYTNREVFGKKGDFITSPEISQMFGELLAIWCLHEWQVRASSTSELALRIVELGPGRGTLAADMLRTFIQFDGVQKILSFCFVEMSSRLCQTQYAKLTLDGPSKVDFTADEVSAETQQGVPLTWYKKLDFVPRSKCFTCYIAHEFFDALPIHIFRRTDRGLCEVLIDTVSHTTSQNSNHTFRYVLVPDSMNSVFLRHVSDSDKKNVIEVCPEAGGILEELIQRITADDGVVLIGDYGHTGDKSETFRAFHDHKVCDPLTLPGLCDLTADVDFSYLTNVASASASVFGPITQAAFLGRMGIGVRLRTLLEQCRSADVRKDLISGFEMLLSPEQMGERFKFMSFGKKNCLVPCAFEQA